jgi:exonuclease III
VHSRLLVAGVTSALREFLNRHQPDIVILSENGIEPIQLIVNAAHLNNLVAHYNAVHVPNYMIDGHEQQGVSVLYHVKWKPETVRAVQALNTVHIVVKHNHYRTHVLGTYGPSKNRNQSKQTFWTGIKTLILEIKSKSDVDQIILIGDLNCVPEPLIDRQKAHINPLHRHSTYNPENKVFRSLLKADDDEAEAMLVDAWRLLHGAKRGFTFIREKKEDKQ